MYLYGERIDLSSLECGGSTEQKSQAAVVEEILRQELTASAEVFAENAGDDRSKQAAVF